MRQRDKQRERDGRYGQTDGHLQYPPVNEQFDPASHRGWKTSETIKHLFLSGSMLIYQMVIHS